MTSFEEAQKIEERERNAKLLKKVEEAMRVRRTDPETSKIAARKVKSGLSETQNMVLTVMREHPAGLTDSELRTLCEQRFGERGDSTYRKRRTDLFRMGIVKSTDERRLNPKGCPETVWRSLSDDELACASQKSA